ncbi:MAG: Uma2 family endonuclease [Eubacterium sp.]|nr:Uma2 family endonuclease [Eubacterium sp.]
MLIETMQAIRDEFHLSYKEISDRSGVPLSTVQKVFGGVTTPRNKTMEELETALVSFIEQGSPRWLGASSFEELMIRGGHQDLVEQLDRYGRMLEEGLVAEEHAYNSGSDKSNKNIDDKKILSFLDKKSGSYTVKDYESLPDDIKVELIDGYFYDMASPSKIHQTILIEMLFQLKSQVAKNKGKCKVYIAPSDVQLDDDENTIVQPDLFILCKKDMIKDVKRTHGAPEFIVEVLSDATRRKDMTLKINKYMNAGVKEYWIVDPDKHYIIKYVFDNMEMANIYTFDDVIPLEIYAGKISVDFDVIRDELEEEFGD